MDCNTPGCAPQNLLWGETISLQWLSGLMIFRQFFFFFGQKVCGISAHTTRDQTHAPCIRVLTTGLPGKSQGFVLFSLRDSLHVSEGISGKRIGWHSYICVTVLHRDKTRPIFFKSFSVPKTEGYKRRLILPTWSSLGKNTTTEKKITEDPFC